MHAAAALRYAAAARGAAVRRLLSTAAQPGPAAAAATAPAAPSAASAAAPRDTAALPPGWPRVEDYQPVELPKRRALQSRSRSEFPEKRGRVHGAPYRQYKGQVSPLRAVPGGIALPPYAQGRQPTGYAEPQIHDAASIAAMRRASAVAAQVLAAAGEMVRPGVTGDQIDDFVHRATLALGAYPSPLGYMGFPKSVCVSVNEVVCHGIPDDCVIQPGDVVKLDVSCFVGGVHGDTCRTWIAGGDAAGDAASRHLMATTKASLDAAIAACGPGMPVSRIGNVVGTIAAREKLEVVSAFSGHGIGTMFHTQPIVHHYCGSHSSYVLRPGMTFTIEPMLVEGTGDVAMWPDGWAVVTTDGGRCAQFEHTLLVTEHGVDVLTRYE